MWEKIHQVGTSETQAKMSQVQLLTSGIQFLFISVPETLLYVNLKSRNFRFSCKNLTTNGFSDTETSDIAK